MFESHRLNFSKYMNINKLLNSHIVKYESVDVGLLLDDLRHRFAAPVSGFAVDTDDLRLIASLRRLQCSRIFERVYFPVDYDETGSIGKRYRRQDEIGTPFSICVDFETEETQTVTIRDRDTMQQERVPISEVRKYIEDRMRF